MRFTYCPHCGSKLIKKEIGESAEETAIREIKEEIGQDVETLQFVQTYPYEKKEMLMIDFKATVKKKDFKLSGEVVVAEWIPLSEALSKLREGGITWQLVRTILMTEETCTG